MHNSRRQRRRLMLNILMLVPRVYGACYLLVELGSLMYVRRSLACVFGHARTECLRGAASRIDVASCRSPRTHFSAATRIPSIYGERLKLSTLLSSSPFAVTWCLRCVSVHTDFCAVYVLICVKIFVMRKDRERGGAGRGWSGKRRR